MQHKAVKKLICGVTLTYCEHCDASGKEMDEYKTCEDFKLEYRKRYAEELAYIERYEDHNKYDDYISEQSVHLFGEPI